MKILVKFQFVWVMAACLCLLKPLAVFGDELADALGAEAEAAARKHSTDEEAAGRTALTETQILKFKSDAVKLGNEVVALGPTKASEFMNKVLKTGAAPEAVVAEFFPAAKKAEITGLLRTIGPNTNANRDLLNNLSRQILTRELAASRPPGSSTGADGKPKPQTQAEREAAAKTEAEVAARKKAEEEAKLQQAFLQGRALQDAQNRAQQQQQQNGSGGAGGGSGGSGGGKGGAGGANQQSPSLSSPEGIGDALDKFKHGNDETRKTSDTRNAVNPNNFNNFGNSSGSGSSSSDDKKKEPDKFNFDTSPKVTQKDEDGKPKKTEGSGETKPVDASTPSDPSAIGLNNAGGSPGLILSGPTSVGQLIQKGSLGGAGSEGGGGSEGGNGSVASLKGGTPQAQDSGYLGGGDPFKSVGMTEMPPIDPPIRKVSVEMGGGSGGDGGGDGGSSESDSGTKIGGKVPSFVSQLVLTTETEKTKALGLMAFVGEQLKDVCEKAFAEGKEIGICPQERDVEENPNHPTKESTVSTTKGLGK